MVEESSARAFEYVRRENRLAAGEQIESAVPEVARVIRRVYEDRFSRMGLSLTQAMLIGNLDLAKGHVLNQTDLANRLGLRKAAIGAAIDGLVVRGYIARSDDPADGRAKLVTLTKEGSDLAVAIDSAFGELSAALRRGISREQRQSVVALLSLMKQNMLDFDQSGNEAAHANGHVVSDVLGDMIR